MYNKTTIRFGFCDIQNNRGRGRGNRPKPHPIKLFIYTHVKNKIAYHLTNRVKTEIS